MSSTVAAIREAHRQGLRVMLRPYIDVNDGTWRADIVPERCQRLVRQLYRLHQPLPGYRQAPRAWKSSLLGVELINMTDPQYDGNWRALIAQSRARYPGLLTYSANWGKQHAHRVQADHLVGRSSTTSACRPTSPSR